MKVHYRKKFLKQLSKVSTNSRLKIEEFVFKILPQSSSVTENGKLEKLTGYKKFYKVRMGNYRIGIEQADDKSLIIRTVRHRKEIYKYFP